MNVKLILMTTLFCTVNSFALDLAPINKIIQLEQVASYNYELPIKLYVTSEQLARTDRLIEDLNYAQKRFDKCQIKLKVNEVLEVKNNKTLNEWESFWFGSGNTLTDWEKSFFAVNDLNQANILLVDNLNWTVDGQGTWGVGYGPFLIEELGQDSEKEFFINHGIGNVVIGNYRARSTLAHELGHAALGLTHTYDAKNLMSNYHSFEPIQFIDGVAQIPADLEFSQEQCNQGIKESIFLKPIFLNVESLLDNIGEGIVTINGKVIEKDDCVMRLLYENNEYRIEYDYMGAVDFAGLVRFDLAKSRMISPNHFEISVNMKSDNLMAQAICGTKANFSGIKSIQTNSAESKINYEGKCDNSEAPSKKMISLSCKLK